MNVRHFLSLLDFSSQELRQLIDRAITLKSLQRRGRECHSLRGKILALLFEKSSTRTRISFEAGMAQLGGSTLFLSPADTQLGRGEPIPDTARVLSGMVDVIALRTSGHERIELFADYSAVPVVNALTDRFHPCQLLADVQTFVEHRGSIQGATVAWVGDGNNMCHSYINAAQRFDFHLQIACPPGFGPGDEMVAAAADRVRLVDTPRDAVRDAHLVVTDVWASMGQEEEQAKRARAFADWQVDAPLLAHAAPDALVMHCLPAHRGEEISHEVLEGPQSVVWEEAQNRLHAQKALLEFLLAR